MSELTKKHFDKTELKIITANQDTGFRKSDFIVNKQGKRMSLINVTPKIFDARTRPWYKKAIEAKTPVWSGIYSGFTDRKPLITASRPIFDLQGNLLGVAGVDLFLTDISPFLKSIDLGRGSEIFIIERNANIVGSSTDEKPFVITDPKQPPQRLVATSSTEALIKAATQFLQQSYQHLNTKHI
jgi:hypothetical protein